MQNRLVFFDADDTLWENERFFRKAEDSFVQLMSGYATENEIRKTLAEEQENNIPIFGYGSKTYLIGMTDCAVRLCGEKFCGSIYKGINGIIRSLAAHRLDIIDGVEETLETLGRDYRLVIATKGDLKEQTDKFRKSGLTRFFHHIEVLENKDEENYSAMAARNCISPEELIMIGNSVKSDIVPVINLGGTAIHIPHEIVWEHEKMEMPLSEKVFEAGNIKELPEILGKFSILAR